MDRLKEGSTWAGIGIFFQILANFFPAYALYAHALSGGAAAIAAALPDAGKAAASATAATFDERG